MKPALHIIAAAFASATVLHAQPEDGGPPGPPPPPVVATLDSDHDGTISAEEIENAAESLATLDANGDGELTREELRPRPPEDDAGEEKQPERPAPPRGRMGPPPVIAALDQDRDGTISAEELEMAAEALAELDQNGDGELSPEELFPRRRRGQGPPQGGPGGPQGGPGGRQGGPGPRAR